MHRLSILTAALLIGSAQAAAAEQGPPEDPLVVALRAEFEREFIVSGCNGQSSPCSRNALALPKPQKTDISATCLKSVLPDVSYIRDGKSSLGAEFEVIASAPSDTKSGYRKLGSFPAITVTEDTGLVDLCIASSVKVAGQDVKIRISGGDYFDENGTGFPAIGGGVLGGILSSGRIGGLLLGIGSLNRLRALPMDAISTLLGDTTTGVVRVTIVSATPGQIVKVGSRSVGQTTIEKIGMPKLSLKKLQIGQAKMTRVLDSCAAYATDGEYVFKC